MKAYNLFVAAGFIMCGAITLSWATKSPVFNPFYFGATLVGWGCTAILVYTGWLST